MNTVILNIENLNAWKFWYPQGVQRHPLELKGLRDNCYFGVTGGIRARLVTSINTQEGNITK